MKCEKKAHKAFTKFLTQMGCNDLEYWLYEEPELDNYLAKYWLGARKYTQHKDSDDEAKNKDVTDKLYSVNTIHNFWYALNHILKQKSFFI